MARRRINAPNDPRNGGSCPCWFSFRRRSEAGVATNFHDAETRSLGACGVSRFKGPAPCCYAPGFCPSSSACSLIPVSACSLPRQGCYTLRCHGPGFIESCHACSLCDFITLISLRVRCSWPCCFSACVCGSRPVRTLIFVVAYFPRCAGCSQPCHLPRMSSPFSPAAAVSTCSFSAPSAPARKTAVS